MECYGSTTMVSDKTEACVYKLSKYDKRISNGEVGGMCCKAFSQGRKDYKGLSRREKKKDLESHIYLD